MVASPAKLLQSTLDSDSQLVRLDRLRMVVEGETHDGRDGRFLHALPVELFLHAIAFLDWPETVTASHVSVYWRKAILAHETLWQELTYLDPADLNSIDRARAVAARSRGGIKVLELFVNLSGELSLQVVPVVASLRAILREISKSGAKHLKTISLDLMAFRALDDIEPAYQLIQLLAQFAEHSAVNLEQLTVTSELRRFPSGAPFFAAMPGLQRLQLTSSSEEPFGDARLPDFLSAPTCLADYQVSSCALRSLTLSGTSLMDSMFPALPELCTIKLYNVNVANLFELLKVSKPTTLWLIGTQSDPPSKFFPPAVPPAVEKNAAPILSLPYLRHVRLCGRSALLWSAPSAASIDFLTETPFLRTANFNHQPVFDLDSAYESGEDESVHAADRLSADILSTFFRTSTHLAQLNLAGTNVTSAMLLTALPYASHSLQRLNLAQTAATTDALIDHLHLLTPSLNYLNVQESEADAPVTIPALARFASRLLRASPLPRWLGSFSLTLVADEPFPSPPALPTPNSSRSNLASLTAELRTALAVLSPTQVDLLSTTAITLNDPPNAIPFVTVRQEVKSLAGTNTLTAGQALVDVAIVAVAKWQRRREDEWAIEWCAQNRVELVWDGEGDSEDEDEDDD